jgi:hypothetical protein
MNWSDKKLTDGFIERTFTFASTDELNNFRRIIPGDDELPETHRQEFRYVPSPNPNGLAKLVIAPRPRSLGDIAAATGNFDKLDVRSLRALVEREGATMPPKDDKAPKQDEREALIAALRDRLKHPKAAAPVTPAPLIVPSELRDLPDADLEVKAVRLGVGKEYANARRRGKPHGIAVLVKKMNEIAEREAVTA